MDLRPKYAHPGEIRATVKGTLPLGQDYSELGLGASITLPDQWAALAGALATDADPTNANPAMRWDIHDEMVDENGNAVAAPVGSGVGGRSDPTHDAVVNIPAFPFGGGLTWNGDASFTRILASSNSHIPFAVPSDFPTAGPFDPNYAEQTLLPDGHLDAGDAPMPAARIDFAIAANTNPLTSTDGVGSLVNLTSRKVYSQDDRATTRRSATCSRRSTRSTSRQPLVIRSATPPALTARSSRTTSRASCSTAR